MDHPCLTLPSVSSSAASVPAAECPDDLLSALVAPAPPESVDPSTSTSTPDSDCWSTLKPAIVSALIPPVQTNPFGAHPFQALQDVVRDAYTPPTVALERPQHPQSYMKPEESWEHELVPSRTKTSLEYVLA